ncbi:urotensin-related peptide 1 [Podarcis lilfordi]|uniref:Urotensin-related peptide 1 n=1 Tax=Podarcis lilfordi TaxID=74358 RepID=A0AA35LC81_9SAUR|nr:urotensin-related peptide 1 [Podarcis lilfordi]
MKMQFQILAYVMVALSSTCCVAAYPVYPDIEAMQDFVPTDFNLVDSAVGFIPDDAASFGLRPSRNLNAAHSALEEGINQVQKSRQWNGGKESLQDDSADNLVEDIKAILWKLAAADKFRSQAFVKADQSPQKPSKRACFWKYCVTN